MFKLLVLDVDGVMTDGTKLYDNTGYAFYKAFCDRDFTAIKRFQSVGIEVVWLSGDKNINAAIATKRNIPFYLSVNYNKPETIKQIVDIYNTSLSLTAYVGDDWYDLETLKVVGSPFCTSVAPKVVQNICEVIPRKGGDGIVAWLYDNYIEKLI